MKTQNDELQETLVASSLEKKATEKEREKCEESLVENNQVHQDDEQSILSCTKTGVDDKEEIRKLNMALRSISKEKRDLEVSHESYETKWKNCTQSEDTLQERVGGLIQGAVTDKRMRQADLQKATTKHEEQLASCNTNKDECRAQNARQVREIIGLRSQENKIQFTDEVLKHLPLLTEAARNNPQLTILMIGPSLLLILTLLLLAFYRIKRFFQTGNTSNLSDPRAHTRFELIALPENP
jgi:hypothetical protein